MLEYRYKAWYRDVRNNIVKMAINSGGIRDTSRVPGVSKTTVINVLKSKESLLLLSLIHI
ncbi:IS1-like element transposase, partial [Endozoicomonas sp.]|uniref:IS1-like element transposase n=1 Tax=Endozoicomonas sp. TaxID=1892382 RepID=UPI00383AF2D6